MSDDRLHRMINDPNYFKDAIERRRQEVIAERRERNLRKWLGKRWIPPFGTRRRNRIHAEAVTYLETHWMPLSIREQEACRRAFIHGYTAAKGWDK